MPIVGMSWVAPKIGFVPSMAPMLFLGIGIIGFAGYRRKIND